MSDHCTLPPPGWACTRARGHSGPCATVRLPDRVMWADEDESDKGTHRRTGCIVALCVTLLAWAVIVAAVARWMDEPVKVRDNRTACERSNPPWAIAERCRR